MLGGVVAVPPPFEANLKKYRDEVITANPEWRRPMQQQVLLGHKDGKPVYAVKPVLDPKGRPIIENLLVKVTADQLGADV